MRTADLFPITEKDSQDDGYIHYWRAFLESPSTEDFTDLVEGAPETFRDCEPAISDQLLLQLYGLFQNSYGPQFALLEDANEVVAQAVALRSHLLVKIDKVGFSADTKRAFNHAFRALLLNSVDMNKFNASLERLFSRPIVTGVGASTVVALLDLDLGVECQQLVSRALRHDLAASIRDSYAKLWDRPVVENLRQWVRTSLVSILADMPVAEQQHFSENALELARTELALLRITELYDMVVQYPKSRHGLIDLKQTMNNPKLRAHAISTFQKACSRRLLNNGVPTVEIFLVYLATIQAFTLLDPRGVLLDVVTKPISRCLKDRPDSVTAVVDGLMEKPGSPLAYLAHDLAASSKMLLLLEKDDLQDAMWLPDPVDAPPNFVKRRAVDTVSTLLSLYENKEIFIKQLTQAVSDKLFESHTKDELDAIRTKTSALKQRFGDRHLQHIDVMISDVVNSQSVNRSFAKRSRNLRALEPLIISKPYWPARPTGELLLPPTMRAMLDDYSHSYSEIRSDLELSWLLGRGRMSITIELADRKVETIVNPQQMVLLHAFTSPSGKNSQHTAGSLMTRTGLSEQEVSLSLRFWMNKQVIGKFGEGYGVLETREAAEEADSIVRTMAPKQNSDLISEMHRFWSYVVGMLTNLGPMPVEKIQSFLVMLVPKDDPYLKSRQELETFLQHMIDQDKLACVEGKFKLPQ